MPYFIKRAYQTRDWRNRRIGFPVPLEVVEPILIEAIANHWVECSSQEYWQAILECEKKIVSDAAITGYPWISLPVKSASTDEIVVWQVYSDQYGRGWIYRKRCKGKSFCFDLIVPPRHSSENTGL
jgi:hypothetical protein